MGGTAAAPVGSRLGMRRSAAQADGDTAATPSPSPSAHPADQADADPDAGLVAAFRAGDVAAFEALYRRHHRHVHVKATRVISDVHRAEDIAQEAFLRLARQLLSTEGEIRVRAWLHRTTTNLAIDEHRRSRSQMQFQEPGSALDDLHNVVELDEAAQPERMAEKREIRALIARVIENLPPRYQQILALRELGGLDYPSIAQTMGISVSAVESLLFRARRRFTDVYAALTDEPARGRRSRRVAGGD